MVLLRGRRGFVILLWCVTSESFDRVRRSSCVNRRPATARSGTCVRDELEWTSGVVRKRAVCHNGSVRSRAPARVSAKKTRQAAQHVFIFAVLSGILRGPSRRLRTLPPRNLF